MGKGFDRVVNEPKSSRPARQVTTHLHATLTSELIKLL